jgi:hypothetical protein
MKIKSILIAMLLTGFLITYSQAQSEPNNQMFMVWMNQVPPEHAAQYENVVKLQAEILKKYHHNIPYYVFATDDYYYYWVTPIDNLAAIEGLNKNWEEFNTEVKQKEGSYPYQQFKGLINGLTPQVIMLRSDLSYFTPVTTNIAENPYFRFGYCYVNEGYEKDFEENWEKWVELFKKNNAVIGWNLYEGILGTENPFYLWGETYKNETDMATSRAKAFEGMGEEANNLWQETISLLRKIEYKTGWYRPDLSYIPEN